MPNFRLSYHSADWQQQFEQAKSMILWATEGWIKEVYHFGSTALEAGVAVPTIDMLAGIEQLSALNEASHLIEGLRYQRLPAPAWTDRELVASLVRYQDQHPTHSILIVKFEGQLWKQCQALQQRLAEDYLIREKLETLKKEHLSANGAPENYVAAKQDFFERLLNNLPLG